MPGAWAVIHGRGRIENGCVVMGPLPDGRRGNQIRDYYLSESEARGAAGAGKTNAGWRGTVRYLGRRRRARFQSRADVAPWFLYCDGPGDEPRDELENPPGFPGFYSRESGCGDPDDGDDEPGTIE